jgi:methionyl-tRNA formyltransferase
MKVLFAGSPASSAQILKFLYLDGFKIVGVISQPDKRTKRGKDKDPSSVSAEASKLNLSVYKPERLDKSFQNEIKDLEFDFLVVSAYGKILPEWLLDKASVAPINIHFSLLPKYRGASPIQSAILDNESKTGISIMEMTEGLDEGPVYSFYEHEILISDSKIDLEEKLAVLCTQNLGKDLRDIYSKKIAPVPQRNDEASYCKKIDKLSGLINFSTESAEMIFQKYKAFYGWPGIYFIKNNIVINIHGLREFDERDFSHMDKQFKFIKNGLAVKTIDKTIVITHLQFPGKRIISSSDAANSYSNFFQE